MTVQARKWIRAGLVYLTVSFLTVGVWATLDPRGFYDGFPGGGHRWIAGDGPYNAHLTGDAGVGFLAVGVVLLLAAVWMDVRVIQAASAAAVVHGAPHLLFHLRHPNDALDSVDTALSNGGLAMGCLLALAVLVVVTRAGHAEPCKKTEDRREPIPSVGSTAIDNGERKDVLQDETS